MIIDTPLWYLVFPPYVDTPSDQPLVGWAPPTSTPVALPPAPEDDLSSEKGIDYRNLHDLLKAGQWREADTETYETMIRVVGKKSGDWFTRDELLNFLCTDLLTIDRLWVKYSNGRFGFSVQKKIYVDCGAKLDGDYPGYTVWNEFCDRVGWRKGGNFQSYAKLQANPSLSPRGEFPFIWFSGFNIFQLPWLDLDAEERGTLVVLVGARKQVISSLLVSSLASRLVNCSR